MANKIKVKAPRGARIHIKQTNRFASAKPKLKSKTKKA